LLWLGNGALPEASKRFGPGNRHGKVQGTGGLLCMTKTSAGKDDEQSGSIDLPCAGSLFDTSGTRNCSVRTEAIPDTSMANATPSGLVDRHSSDWESAGDSFQSGFMVAFPAR
jgi:hypothetical protein